MAITVVLTTAEQNLVRDAIQSHTGGILYPDYQALVKKLALQIDPAKGVYLEQGGRREACSGNEVC